MNTAVQTTGQGILAQHHDAMVSYLVTEFGDPVSGAELRITQLWDRVTARLVKERGYTLVMASRMLDQALQFLAQTSTVVPEEWFDPAWHVLQNYSQEYFALCHAARGRYVHHLVQDVAGIHDRAEWACNRPCSSDCDMS